MAWSKTSLAYSIIIYPLGEILLESISDLRIACVNQSIAIIALLLPWAGSACWLRRTLPVATLGTWPIALGYGLPLGLLITTLLMRFWDALGFGLSPVPVLLSWAVIGGFGLWSCWRHRAETSPGTSFVVPSGWTVTLSLLLLGLIVLRLGSLGLELFWLPLFPWDAWTVWLLRAEIWAHHGTLVEFVERTVWLQSNDPAAYTTAAWHYPRTVSLIAAWMMVTAGPEQEGWWHLPWLLALSGCALGLYGQVRCWGGSPLAGLMVVYLVVSLPLLGAHVALAGYADIWVATVLTLGGVAAWRWLLHREHGGLALVMLALLPLLKFEGTVWLLILVPALAVTLLRPVRAVMLGVALAVGAGFWWWFDGVVLTLPGPGTVAFTPQRLFIQGLVDLPLTYQPEALAALGSGLWELANWHVLGFAAVAALLVGILLGWRHAELRAPTASMLTAAGLLMALFLFTRAAEWAILQTSSNRLVLHFAPLLVFYVWLVWRTLVEVTPQPMTGADTALANR